MSPTTWTNRVHSNWGLQWDEQRGAITTVHPAIPCPRDPRKGHVSAVPWPLPSSRHSPEWHGAFGEPRLQCHVHPCLCLASSASTTLAMLCSSQLQLERSCCCFPGHCATLLGLGKCWEPGKHDRAAFPCPFCSLSFLEGVYSTCSHWGSPPCCLPLSSRPEASRQLGTSGLLLPPKHLCKVRKETACGFCTQTLFSRKPVQEEQTIREQQDG